MLMAWKNLIGYIMQGEKENDKSDRHWEILIALERKFPLFVATPEKKNDNFSAIQVCF